MPPQGLHISPSPWDLGVEGNSQRGIGVKGRRPGPRPTAGRAERGGRSPRPLAVRLWRWRR